VGAGRLVTRAAARGGEAVELTVVLRDTEPIVWRRIVVPTSLTLRRPNQGFSVRSLSAVGGQ
jgi:hypothetical protein